jgi:hypothetical protein
MKAALVAILAAMLLSAAFSVWAANSWTVSAGTLVIDEKLPAALGSLHNGDILNSGIFQLISNDKISGFKSTDLGSVKHLIITDNAANVVSTADNAQYAGTGGTGGIITWEDMAFIGASMDQVETVDMRGANALHGAELFMNSTGWFASLKAMYLPEGIEAISRDSFNGCLPKIETIVFPSTLKTINRSFASVGPTGGAITLVFTGALPPTTVSPDAFGGTTSIGKVIVPSGKEIPYAAALGTILAGKITSVTSITPSPATLESTGGSVSVTVSGHNLSTGLRIAVDGSVVSHDAPVVVSGTNNIQVNGVRIAPNTGTAAAVRTLTVLLDGITAPGISANVTVKAAGSPPPTVKVTSPDKIISVDVPAAGDFVYVLYSGDVTPKAYDKRAGTILFDYPESRFTAAATSAGDSVMFEADGLLIPKGASLTVTFTSVTVDPVTRAVSATRTVSADRTVIADVLENRTRIVVANMESLPSGYYEVKFNSAGNPQFNGTLSKSYAHNVPALGTITLVVSDTPAKGIMASALLLSGGLPAPGVTVSFTVSNSAGTPVTGLTRVTDYTGAISVFQLAPDGLTDDIYEVTAEAEGFEYTEEYVQIGSGVPPAPRPRRGGGCSAGAASMMALAGAALVLRNKRKR